MHCLCVTQNTMDKCKLLSPVSGYYKCFVVSLRYRPSENRINLNQCLLQPVTGPPARKSDQSYAPLNKLSQLYI